MNRDEIIETALRGFRVQLEAVMEAAVRAEREACAQIADREYVSIQTVTMSDGYPDEAEGGCCAERCLIIRDGIRARCNTYATENDNTHLQH